jgi:hypothetical protein
MPRSISEPARQIPVVAEADVVVCGGGPGGFPAAIAAARHGAKVVLIERYGFLGGLATAGLVAPILSQHAHNSEEPIVKGLLYELTGRMHALGGSTSYDEALKEWGIRFDAEAMKVVLDEMTQEAGVHVLLHTWIAGVVTEGKRITSVIVENKSGRQAVTGKVFVDATGDADIAFRAGAPTTFGRAFDGKPESMGSFYQLGNVPKLSEQQGKEIRELLCKQMDAGTFAFYNPNFLAYRCAYHGDHTSANMTRWGGDSTNVSDLIEGEISIRKNIWALVRWLRSSVPGFENVYVQQSSPQIGPRESRQIVGPYALTGDDVRLGRRYDDGVARGSWWIDIHCPLGHTYPVHLCTKDCVKASDCPFWASEHDRMWPYEGMFPPAGGWYDIPYRCLLSVGVPNLLASGRCISATHEGMAGSRVMGSCVAIGQAAGTAAALAVKGRVDPAAVNVQQLRAALTKDGQLV